MTVMPRLGWSLVIGVAVAFGIILIAAPATVLGHASLIAIEPADGAVVDERPAAVVLTFDEPIGLVGDGVTVVGPGGSAVSGKAAVVDRTVTVPLESPAAVGTHLVSWQVVSADGHRIAGGSTFHVGERTTSATLLSATSPPVLGGLIGVLNAVLAGGLLLGLGVTGHAAGDRAGLAGHLRRPALILLALGGLASLLLLPLRAADRAGRWGAVVDGSVLAEAVRGSVGVSTLATIAAVGSVVLWWSRSGAGIVPVALGGSLTVLGLVVDGHTRIGRPVWAAMTTDAVHLVAASVWAGGVTAIALSVVAGATGAARALVIRVSQASVLAVVAVTVGGVATALTIVEDPVDALTGRWGALLALKAIVVGLLIALGAVMRFRIVPAWRAEPDESMVDQRVRHVLVTEVVLFAAVLAISGFLVRTPPTAALGSSGGEAAARPEQVSSIVELSSGSGVVEFAVEPATTGVNEVYLRLTTIDGAPLVTVDPVEVSVREPELGIGPVSAAVHDMGGGLLHAVLDLPVAGRWELTVEARTGTFVTGRAVLTLVVG